MTVLLYDRQRLVELTLRDSGGVMTWNLPMNSNDFRIFKDVQNDVDFYVRNSDRKPVSMIGRTATINFFDQRAERLLHQQDLIVTNDAKGYCRLILSPDVTEDWLLQTYSYSIQVTNLDGSVHMLYTDIAESQRGFFELAQGPIFDPRPSFEVTYDNLFPTNIGSNSQTFTSVRISSAFPGAAQRGNTSGLHTAVAFLDNFSGILKIQVSLEEASPTDISWFDVEMGSYDHQTSVESFTFEANAMWVRFWVVNNYEQNPDVPVLASDVGSITKLVFRN